MQANPAILLIRMIRRLIIGLFVLCSTHTFAQDSTYTNSIGMEFVLIKPGSFIVGKFQPPYPKPSDKKEGGQSEPGYTREEYKLADSLANRDARPGFTAHIRQPFYIGKFEVTQEQWRKVMGSNPSVFNNDRLKTDASMYPVENVTWLDVQSFLTRLNELEKEKHYRLPTELEWEYAARAGATYDISWD
jgi:formylglycine-generating enzyme